VSYTLKPVYDALIDIASDRSRLTKEAKIKIYVSSMPYFEEVVLYAYDYNKKYNVTNVTMQNHNYDLDLNLLFPYLDFLASKKGANAQEKLNLNVLASHDPETVDVVNRIINKDLKCGAGVNTFKKFIKDLPVFEIMTCQRNVNKFLKLTSGKEYYWSNKKDGVRVINIVYEDYVKSHLSRSGLEYPNFNTFDTELIKMGREISKNLNCEYPIYIDGEAIADGKQFNKVMKQIRRLKNIDVGKFKLHVFDIPSDLDFQRRYNCLKHVFDNNTFERLDLVEHHLCNFNEYQINKLSKEVIENGVSGIDEGVVIKIADAPYVFKEKSKYWCKVKPVETLDLEVTGFYLGKHGTRLQNIVGGLIVNYKGVEVHVGSGLSDAQRLEFLDELPEIIEIEYKEVTPDGSLREPIMKSIRNDKLTHD
jgi:DNA ligase 1